MAEDLSVLGSPSYLQSAGELGIGMQRNKLAQQGQNQDAVDNAGALPKAIATQGVEQQMSKITIDDNLAKGLAKMTGQDWSSSVGTKWDPKVFTPMVTGMAQAKYHSDLLNDHDKLEHMKEDAAAKKQKDEDDAKTKRQSDEDAAKAKREKDKTAADASKAKTPKPEKAETPEQKKEKAAKLLDGISKAKDDASKKTAIANYNSVAKDVGLAPYEEEPGFIDKVKGALGFGKSGGVDDAKTAKAKKILQDAGKPVTDANVKHVADQLDDSGN